MNIVGKIPRASQVAFQRLIETIRDAADTACSNENVSLQDKDIIRSCLSDIEAYYSPLVGIISHADTSDHVIDWMGAIVNAAFFIGSYGVIPQSAYKIAQQHQAFYARLQQQAEVSRKQNKVEILLRKHIPDLEAGLQHPSSTAEAILQAINDDLRKAGGKSVTSRTVLRWITKLKNDHKSDIPSSVSDSL